MVIDFTRLDNIFRLQVNDMQLFVGGQLPSEVEFQASASTRQTIRFQDGPSYTDGTPNIWSLTNTNGTPIIRLEIHPNGTVTLSGVKVSNGPLLPLEIYNGLTVNTAAIAAARNSSGPNTITLGQAVGGQTCASGTITDAILCFATTLIDTRRGLVRVEDLRVADHVLTYDHGYQPIRWIGSCHLSAAQLAAQPNLRPIVIRAGALGAGFPKQDLILSPQHRILISSTIAKRMFGRKEVLVPVKKLLPIDGIDIANTAADGVEYCHLLFDDHQIIWSKGSLTESLLTGPQALKAVPAEGRAEIEALFPELCDPAFTPVPARYIPAKGKWVKTLVAQHQADTQPLYAAA